MCSLESPVRLRGGQWTAKGRALGGKAVAVFSARGEVFPRGAAGGTGCGDWTMGGWGSLVSEREGLGMMPCSPVWARGPLEWTHSLRCPGRRRAARAPGRAVLTHWCHGCLQDQRPLAKSWEAVLYFHGLENILTLCLHNDYP